MEMSQPPRKKQSADPLQDIHNNYVLKRNGTRVTVSFDRIWRRLSAIAVDKKLMVNITNLTCSIISRIYPDITTSQIDDIAADECIQLSANHVDYGTLAAHLVVSSHQKNTMDSFSKTMKLLFTHKKNEKDAPLISKELYEISKKHAPVLNKLCEYSRDFNYDYFGFRTLQSRYLIRIGDQVVERPQHMLLRVAIGIHGADLDNVEKTYDLMSRRLYTHATPTLYNSGTPLNQLASCFLLAMNDDSISGIYKTLGDCAMISKHAGGIGVHISNIRASGSYIEGTNGRSNGIVPMLRVFNETARYVDQGGGKRNGSFAMYMEPWHADILSFLELRKNHGDENLKARDLFYALWIPDLFMERVRDQGTWTLFCPNVCPGLNDTYGPAFKELYERYESEGKGFKTIPARTLWFAILDSQIETGMPYMLYKDASNKKSNQNNVGVIKSSNLCAEIIQYSDDKETAVCNLSSIALPMFVDEDTKTYRFDELHAVVKQIVVNMNKVIDVNFYPLVETRRSNMRHRPIGIGVQGLADVFIAMRLPFESEEAVKLNRDIFETIYHAALEQSAELAVIEGPYETFEGSPAHRGQLQYHLWGLSDADLPRYPWAELVEKIKTTGLRNSLLTAVMPTASTSQILGFNECVEPLTSNIYSRTTLSGNFRVVNKAMIQDLDAIGLWSLEMKNKIIQKNGSIQSFAEIPEHIRKLYKTVWEMDMSVLIQMSADRGAFICQSQSLNIWVEDPDYKQLTKLHFKGWNLGLKTGLYYLRRKAKAHAQQFTIAPVKSDELEMPKCDECSA
jgi:ribonucleoside-diphosphate reductase alpha subunit